MVAAVTPREAHDLQTLKAWLLGLGTREDNDPSVEDVAYAWSLLDHAACAALGGVGPRPWSVLEWRHELIRRGLVALDSGEVRP